jgi:two-component system, chemotaxis family, chemotaxis protein CheY
MLDPKTRILIVDDMRLMRRSIVNACKELGVNDISEAPGGHEAFKLATSATPPFDLIISDWNMPEGDGLELLQKIRSDSRIGTTPFLMVTAEKEFGTIDDVVRAGANGFLAKPFTTETLKSQLFSIVKNAKKVA